MSFDPLWIRCTVILRSTPIRETHDGASEILLRFISEEAYHVFDFGFNFGTPRSVIDAGQWDPFLSCFRELQIFRLFWGVLIRSDLVDLRVSWNLRGDLVVLKLTPGSVWGVLAFEDLLDSINKGAVSVRFPPDPHGKSNPVILIRSHERALSMERLRQIASFKDLRFDFDQGNLESAARDIRTAGLGEDTGNQSQIMEANFRMNFYGEFRFPIAEISRRSNRVNWYKWELQRHASNTISPHYYISTVIAFCIISLRMSQSHLVKRDGSSMKMETSLKRLKIRVPQFDNSELIAGYSKTLIGRCMNPQNQDMKILLHMLPRILNVDERVVAADLGMGRFQFDFDREEDIAEILKLEPFHFNYWMVSLVRWEPIVDSSYPSAITFWIRVMGIPLHYWADQTFRSIGEALGVVKEVDIDNGRVQVILDGFKPLCFETSVYCRSCFSLCHDQSACPRREERVEDQDHNAEASNRV